MHYQECVSAEIQLREVAHELFSMRSANHRQFVACGNKFMSQDFFVSVYNYREELSTQQDTTYARHIEFAFDFFIALRNVYSYIFDATIIKSERMEMLRNSAVFFDSLKFDDVNCTQEANMPTVLQRHLKLAWDNAFMASTVFPSYAVSEMASACHIDDFETLKVFHAKLKGKILLNFNHPIASVDRLNIH